MFNKRTRAPFRFSGKLPAIKEAFYTLVRTEGIANNTVISTLLTWFQPLWYHCVSGGLSYPLAKQLQTSFDLRLRQLLFRKNNKQMLHEISQIICLYYNTG